MMVVNWRKRLESKPRFPRVFRKYLLMPTAVTVGRVGDTAAVEASQADERIVELDGLRGLACLLVLVYHIMPHRIPLGWAAVDLFFVLSGYLITSIVLRFSQEDHFLFHFYMRRGLRIWPVYFLTVLMVAVAVPFLPRPYVLASLRYVMTYSQNLPLYWSGNAPIFSSYLEHVWSLAIEEQFYTLWPLLLVLVGRRGVIPLSVALLSTSILARMCGFLGCFFRREGMVWVSAPYWRPFRQSVQVVSEPRKVGRSSSAPAARSRLSIWQPSPQPAASSRSSRRGGRPSRCLP